ncbi:MAG: hypothetical protein ACD_34C00225G0004 [uncultured bacterium]|nr:MAG: hypothetical protein ACD_34C00225G0004 [uncultured bacterium]
MIDGAFDGYQCAVFLGAHLHLGADAVSQQGAGEVFFAGAHPFDGASRNKTGNPGNGLFCGDVRFVAEASAQVWGVNTHIADGYLI